MSYLDLNYDVNVLDAFKHAVQMRADMLIVHHGLFWPNISKIDDINYNRIRYLMDHNLTLFNVHIPLDAHPVIGNNAILQE